jgi:hypothetical protein
MSFQFLDKDFPHDFNFSTSTQFKLLAKFFTVRLRWSRKNEIKEAMVIFMMVVVIIITMMTKVVAMMTIVVIMMMIVVIMMMIVVIMMMIVVIMMK